VAGRACFHSRRRYDSAGCRHHQPTRRSAPADPPDLALELARCRPRLLGRGAFAVGGFLLSALELRREAGSLEAVWLLFGWFGGLLYYLLMYLVKRAALWLWSGRIDLGEAGRRLTSR
jgi:hypothetical protein